MHDHEFNTELDRLCRGFKHKITTERTDALWQAVAHWPNGLLELAATRVLGGKYFPDIDAIEKAAGNVRPKFDARNPAQARSQRVPSTPHDDQVVMVADEAVSEHETVTVIRVDPRLYCASERARDLYVDHFRVASWPELDPRTGLKRGVARC